MLEFASDYKEGWGWTRIFGCRLTTMESVRSRGNLVMEWRNIIPHWFANQVFPELYIRRVAIHDSLSLLWRSFWLLCSLQLVMIQINIYTSALSILSYELCRGLRAELRMWSCSHLIYDSLSVFFLNGPVMDNLLHLAAGARLKLNAVLMAVWLELRSIVH